MPERDLIIWPQPDGPIAVTRVLAPPREGESERDCLLRHARRAVPAGVPFLIVPADVIPADRIWRDAWTADFSAPDGHGEAAA